MQMNPDSPLAYLVAHQDVFFYVSLTLIAVVLLSVSLRERRRKLADLDVKPGKSVESAVRDVFVRYLKSLRKNLAATEKQMARTELPKELHQALASPAREWREKRWVDAVNEMMKRDKTATEMALSTLGYRMETPYQKQKRAPDSSPKREPAVGGGMETAN